MQEIIFNRKTYVLYVISMLIGIMFGLIHNHNTCWAWIIASHGTTLIPQNLIIYEICVYALTIKNIYAYVVIRNNATKIFLGLFLFNFLLLTIYYISINVTYLISGSTPCTGYKLFFTLNILLGRYFVLLMSCVIAALLFSSSNNWFLILLTIIIPIIYHYLFENYFITPIIIKLFS